MAPETTVIQVERTATCDECDSPGMWRIETREYDPARRPPYRFRHGVYCDNHLPSTARAFAAEHLHAPRGTAPDG